MLLKSIILLLFSFSLLAQEIDRDEAIKMAHIAKAKSRLKQIGTTYAMYFTDGGEPILPTPQVVDLDETIYTYFHPETGKNEKFLFIQPGYRYSGSADLLLAVTNKPINGKYLACFEDGHVENISVEFFKQHALVLGLKKEKTNHKDVPKEAQAELKKLIDQLGARKFKERKEAKTKILEKGPDILGFLIKNRENPDFEIKVSINEIIKTLEGKVPQALHERPVLKR